MDPETEPPAFFGGRIRARTISTSTEAIPLLAGPADSAAVKATPRLVGDRLTLRRTSHPLETRGVLMLKNDDRE